MRSAIMVDVVDVTVLGDYRVHLRFDNGEEGEVDLRPFFNGPVFAALLLDRHAFESVRVDPELGTIVWPNGADVDPDVLHNAVVGTRPR
jgi:Protein of unknown function (DUF2442)